MFTTTWTYMLVAQVAGAAKEATLRRGDRPDYFRTLGIDIYVARNTLVP